MEQHTGIDVFKPEELERWVARMEANRAWLAERGIPFFIVLAPDKNTIYPERLPHYPRGAVTRADQIAARLKGSALTFIDPRAAMAAAKARYPLLYPGGDSHWGQRAAHMAYAPLIQALAPLYPKLEAVPLDRYAASTGPVAKDLSYLIGLQLDLDFNGEILTRKEPSRLLSTEVRPGGTPWGWPVKFHKSDLKEAPRALIFGDSFTDYVLGPSFLYETFRDPVFTHHNLGNFNFTLVGEVKPDLVLFVVAERYLKTIPGPPVGF
jgi:alginate O-acetyltransferase complex protein AlgJ